MMRAELVAPIAARAVDFDTSSLLDLSGTPWRRIWLSAREPIFALVDAVDFDWLSQEVWNVWHDGRKHWQLYAKRNVGRSRATVRMHREIQIQAEPLDEALLALRFADHINGQTLDNRRANLRWATKQENNLNRRMRGTAPSLEAILADLLAELPARPSLEEIPF